MLTISLYILPIMLNVINRRPNAAKAPLGALGSYVANAVCFPSARFEQRQSLQLPRLRQIIKIIWLDLMFRPAPDMNHLARRRHYFSMNNAVRPRFTGSELRRQVHLL